MNTLVALCAVGAEKILGNEIKHLGYKLESNAPGRVSFLATMMLFSVQIYAFALQTESIYSLQNTMLTILMSYTTAPTVFRGRTT